MMLRASRIDRRALLRLAAVAGCAPRLAAAQSAAQRPLRWIVPFPAGGTTDLVTRVVASDMAVRLGQTVVVDNRPGAGTVIGVDAAAKAAADASTLVSVANSFCVNQTLVRRLPYDGLRDLRPIGLMGRSDHVLVTHPGSGLRTVADLRAALGRPGAPLSYASFGNGTSAHLAGATLQLRLGAPLIHVPYKGQAPALADLLGAQVTMMFGNWPELRQHIASGRLVALGVATARRTLEAPGIPTLAEQGVPIESNSWSGMMTRAGAPDAAVARLSAALRQALQAPTVRRMFADEAITSLEGTPQQFGTFIRSEIDSYAQVIRQAGITDEG